MPVTLSDWRGQVQRDLGQPAALKAALGKSNGKGGSGAFLGLGGDERKWWIKPLNNPQSQRVPINEQIVGRAAALIGAPACGVALIEVTPDVAGWNYHDQLTLELGIAHGSAAVTDGLEQRTLTSGTEDDNRRRHAGIFALWDWCWGGDEQFLYATTDDNRIYSHDHGHFFPGGPNWTVDLLTQSVDVPMPLPRPATDLDVSTLHTLADRLDQIPRSGLQEVLGNIPRAWPISDEELETMGYFLEYRAAGVAVRLRQLARSLTTPTGGSP